MTVVSRLSVTNVMTFKTTIGARREPETANARRVPQGRRK